jgi:hypothetical protein
MRNYGPIKLIQLYRETGLPFTLMLKRARELNICPSKNLVLTEIDDLSVVTDETEKYLIIPSKINKDV